MGIRPPDRFEVAEERTRASAPSTPQGVPQTPAGVPGAPGEPIETVAALSGDPVLEGWDDLIDLEPGQRALVPLPSPLADAVFTWARALEGEGIPAELACAVRGLLMAMHEHDVEMMMVGAVDLLRALSALVQAYEA